MADDQPGRESKGPGVAHQEPLAVSSSRGNQDANEPAEDAPVEAQASPPDHEEIRQRQGVRVLQPVGCPRPEQCEGENPRQVAQRDVRAHAQRLGSTHGHQDPQDGARDYEAQGAREADREPTDRLEPRLDGGVQAGVPVDPTRRPDRAARSRSRHARMKRSGASSRSR